MAVLSPFARQMERLFPASIRARGQGYSSGRRVEFEHIADQGVVAFVHGSGGRDYQVTLDWNRESGVVACDCDCPYFADEGPCKHLWAVILRLETEVDPAKLPQKVTKIEQQAGEGGIDLDESRLDELTDAFSDLAKRLGLRGLSIAPPQRKKSKPRKKKPKPPPPPAWVGELAPVRQTPGPVNLLNDVAHAVREELKLLLDVGASQAQRSLWLRLICRERGITGKFGKWKQKTLYPDELYHQLTPHELLLLELTEAIDESRPRSGGYYYGRRGFTDAVLRDSAALPILRKCCDAGIVEWKLNAQDGDTDGERVTWDDGPPWELQVHIAADEAHQEWVVTGWLVRTGTDVALAPHAAVLAIGGLAVLHEQRLGLFPHPEQAGWVEALRRKPEIRVPFADRDRFVEQMFSGVAAPITRWPENLQIPHTRSAPIPRLTLRSWQRERSKQRTILGEVSFEYDGYACTPRESKTMLRVADPERVIVRDVDAEREWLRRLLETPAITRHVDDNRYGYYYQGRPPEGHHDIEFSDGQLTSVLESLSAAGWRLETEGQLVRSAGAFSFEVTSDVDWFDLHGRCDFGGISAELPELLKAVRAGDRFITLGDGSRGLLPDEVRQRLERFAGYGREEGKGVRFSGAQTLLLDALLAAQDAQTKVQVDARYRQLRRKLQEVSGVKPKSEGKSFQGTLRDYQREGLGWLKFLQEFGFGGCLADDMGLGKTIQVLALLEDRRRRKPTAAEPHRPSLAIVPKSLIFNWVNEAAKFTPNLRVAAYHGLGRKAQLEKLADLDLLVTTYGTLRQDIGDLSEQQFDYAILDEAQAIKNPTTHAAKAVRLINAKHRLAMTGTPIENSLADLWSLFEFLNPGLLGRSQNFQRLTKQLKEEPTSLETLSRGIRPYVLRRTKEQVLTELPEKTEQTIQCELSPKERKLYNELRDHYRRSLLGHVEEQGLAKSKIHILEALLRLRQAACHPGLVNKAYLKESSTKLDTLEEQLESLLAEGHKALVFSQFTSLLSILKARLDRKQIVYEYLDGQTTKRQQCVERFQSDESCRLFLISLKAGGQGLNLTAADYVFILDPWWNPAVEAQAVDRAHRLGQEQHVFAYRLIASDTVEEKILALQAQKRQLADSIITEDTSILQSLSMEDLQLLLS